MKYFTLVMTISIHCLFSSTVFALDFGDLFHQADTVFCGEEHYIKEQHDSLITTLENGTINTFTTEYELEEFNEEFQSYLSDPAATWIWTI